MINLNTALRFNFSPKLKAETLLFLSEIYRSQGKTDLAIEDERAAQELDQGILPVDKPD